MLLLWMRRRSSNSVINAQSLQYTLISFSSHLINATFSNSSFSLQLTKAIGRVDIAVVTGKFASTWVQIHLLLALLEDAVQWTHIGEPFNKKARMQVSKQTNKQWL